MKLSWMNKGDIGRLNGEIFMVTDATEGDRVSGFTYIVWRKDKREETFMHDREDPEVEKIGEGSRKIKIAYNWGGVK